MIATTTSGLAISYAVVSGPATLTNHVLTLTGSGTIIVIADQAGNGNYHPAPQVIRTITVNPAITITPTSAIVTANHLQNVTLTANFGTGTKSFSLSQPAGMDLTPGLSLTPSLTSAGILTIANTWTGTTAASGTITVVATDSIGAVTNQDIVVTVNPAITVTPTTVIVTANHSQVVTLTATQGTGSKSFGPAQPTVTNATSGLTLNPTLSSEGLLTIASIWTGSTAASGTITVIATDANGGTTIQGIVVTVNPAISISPSSVIATANHDQTWNLSAIGGTGGKTFGPSQPTTKNLTTGLVLTPTLANDGRLTISSAWAGSMAASGTVTVVATDTLGASTNHDVAVTVNPTIVITPTTATITANNRQIVTLKATGGTNGLTFGPAQPTVTIQTSGLTLSPSLTSDGTLTIDSVWTGGTVATGTITVIATDANQATTTQDIVITVNPVIAIAAPDTVATTVTRIQVVTLAASGGTSTVDNPIRFATELSEVTTGLTLTATVSGSSLTINPTSYAGTAPATAKIRITATDNLQAISIRDLIVTVNPAIALTTDPASPVKATINKDRDVLVLHTGGTGGISVQAVLSITGTTTWGPNEVKPTVKGVNGQTVTIAPGTLPCIASVVITATDAVGATGTTTFTVNVSDPLAWVEKPPAQIVLVRGESGEAIAMVSAGKTTGGQGSPQLTSTGVPDFLSVTYEASGNRSLQFSSKPAGTAGITFPTTTASFAVHVAITDGPVEVSADLSLLWFVNQPLTFTDANSGAILSVLAYPQTSPGYAGLFNAITVSDVAATAGAPDPMALS